MVAQYIDVFLPTKWQDFASSMARRCQLRGKVLPVSWQELFHTIITNCPFLVYQYLQKIVPDSLRESTRKPP